MDSSLTLGMTKKSVRNDHTAVMLSEAKHPYWIDLTLFAGANVPFLLQEEGQKVVYLSKRAYR